MAKDTNEIAKEEVEKADMVSLKRTAAEKKARNEPSVAQNPYSGDDYPYSTRIDLEDEILSKLGLKTLPELGEELSLTAKVEVTRTSESEENGEKKRRSMCLQITRMSLK